jgi:hypothetical protein
MTTEFLYDLLKKHIMLNCSVFSVPSVAKKSEEIECPSR